MTQSMIRLGRTAMQSLLMAPALCLMAQGVQASCNADLLNQAERNRPRNGTKGKAVQPAARAPEPAFAQPPLMDPQLQLQTLAREAVRRSAQIGAVKLLVEAAQYDVDETRGAGLPQM